MKAQDTLNFSAGIERDNLSITIWGKNINDDKYLISAEDIKMKLGMGVIYSHRIVYAIQVIENLFKIIAYPLKR